MGTYFENTGQRRCTTLGLLFLDTHQLSNTFKNNTPGEEGYVPDVTDIIECPPLPDRHTVSIETVENGSIIQSVYLSGNTAEHGQPISFTATPLANYVYKGYTVTNTDDPNDNYYYEVPEFTSDPGLATITIDKNLHIKFLFTATKTLKLVSGPFDYIEEGLLSGENKHTGYITYNKQIDTTLGHGLPQITLAGELSGGVKTYRFPVSSKIAIYSNPSNFVNTDNEVAEAGNGIWIQHENGSTEFKQFQPNGYTSYWCVYLYFDENLIIKGSAGTINI